MAWQFYGRNDLIVQADDRLVDAEGHGLERLVDVLYQERSRKGVGTFPLTRRVDGFWDRGDTEIDLVAVNEEDRILRLGTCKRQPEKLVADLPRFEEHVARFRAASREFDAWKFERVAIAPTLQPSERVAIERKGFVAEDLRDLTAVLLP